MARKQKNEAEGKNILKEETLQSIIAIVLFALGLTLVLAGFGSAGPAGETLYALLTRLVGIGYFLLPIACFILGAAFFKNLHGHFPLKKIFGTGIFLLSGLGTIEIILPTQGGFVGKVVESPLVSLFDVPSTLIIFAALFVIALLVIFDTRIPVAAIASFFTRKTGAQKTEPKITGVPYDEDELPVKKTSKKDSGEDAEEEEDAEESSLNKSKSLAAAAKLKEQTINASIQKKMDRRAYEVANAYVPPPLSLLEHDRGKPGVGDIKANANIIKRTLQNFGIDVEMDEISIGPSVTRYALKPAEGVKLSRIVALQNDLALALAAHPIRIEAPIPGKSLVGIEIPNNVKATVGLATMLGHGDFSGSEKPLLVSLGKDLTGKPHFGNLAKMPHLLIAGATGSGKSVTIHTIITSLLFKGSPDDLKLIMIDPKRVELTLYNKIPHLLTPVITEAKKAILSLKWAAKEMDRRYDILESESVRDIQSYHKNILEPELKKLEKSGPIKVVEGETPPPPPPERMPYIVIIIDELADIMATYPRELEASIVRLAQMSRAVGIHLILSTQRPSVNVITGLIKANIPGRVALQVASQIDSRTILDTGGAEKLLGAGDMLFLSGEMSKPTRLQSAFVSESEVKKVVGYLTNAYRDAVPNELNLSGENVMDKNTLFEGSLEDGEDVDDDLYEQAREEVVRAGKASTSYLQRKLRVGYARAARLVDLLEERGVIGAADGSKPRDVVMKSGTEPAVSSPESEEANRSELNNL